MLHEFPAPRGRRAALNVLLKFLLKADSLKKGYAHVLLLRILKLNIDPSSPISALQSGCRYCFLPTVIIKAFDWKFSAGVPEWQSPFFHILFHYRIKSPLE